MKLAPQRHSQRVTIIDIATAAGVSKSAVSLALRGDSGVSAETREKVERIADELGYRSNIWARSLVQGSVGIVGILVTDLKNDYHTDVVTGIEDAAEAHGLGVIIANGRREPERLTTQLNRLVELRCKGIVVVSAHTPYDSLHAAARNTKIAVVGRPGEVPPNVANIRNDDEAGAYLAVQHLIDSGRSRIAFLQKSDAASTIARRDAYIATMEDAGLQPHIFRRHNLAERSNSGAPLAGCDAVFASNDQMAALALGWAHDNRVDVPHDLAIVGYDDTELAQVLRPQLSSVAQPRVAMGQRAFEIVTSERSGDAPREVFAPELMVRASSR